MSWTPLSTLLVVLVGGWLAAFAVVTISTRPRAVRPAPAGPSLGPEPPAVVNLLVSRWRLTEDAAEATVLDLAARGFLELRQTGPEAARTTIHLRSGDESQLLPYERRVLERIRRLAVDGALPVTALTFRSARQATAWRRHLHKEVIADARARGLSRSRFSTRTQALLSGAAGVASFVPLVLALFQNLVEFPVLVIGIVGSGLASQAMTKLAQGERDTAAGRAAASHWLGVREWLRGHPEFAELAPASVTVWDRYLAHGAALGVTRTASAILDLGMGDPRRVWSAYGGRWRRVRVRYPSFRPHYGQSVPGLLGQTVVLTVVAGMLGGVGSMVIGVLAELGAPAPLRVAGWAAAGVAALLLTYNLYALVRGLIDLAREQTVTGEVLWLRVARRRGSRSGSRGTPWLYHLAVDDGSADLTRAWGLPPDAAATLHPGDVVRLQVRPFTRRVTHHRVLRPGPERGPVPTAVHPSAAG